MPWIAIVAAILSIASVLGSYFRAPLGQRDPAALLDDRRRLASAFLVPLFACGIFFQQFATPTLTFEVIPVFMSLALVALATALTLRSKPYAALLALIALCAGLTFPWIGPAGGSQAPLFSLLVLGLLMGLRRDEMSRDRGLQARALLEEHEWSGRGWFWETDGAGRLTYISETLVQRLGVSAEGMIGRALTDLLIREEGEPIKGERAVEFHLSSRTPFSDIAVRGAVAKEESWWAMSGRPIFDDKGQFHGFRGSGTDLTEMRRSQAEVTRLALFDSLTGLANRSHMLDSLQRAVAVRSGQLGECTLMMLDLDRFKMVNDTLGHPAGDALLRQVSQRLQRVVGDIGLVGRQGGDEFKILLPGQHDQNDISHLAQAIITSVSKPYLIEGNAVCIGVSIGISVCPNDGPTADELIRNADLALYAAKGEGRGIHRFYAREMHAQVEDRRALEDELRQALVTDGLSIVFQPVVECATGHITGYEALLRWIHSERGPVSPALFIPLAEDVGLIGALGEWVLRRACHEAAKWPIRQRVAVNVSPIQFANPDFPNVVMSALAASMFPPERLELEITESVFLSDSENTDAMFAKLKALGVRLSLDDFGTGYSSLSYLKKAPFDRIKIDQSFVRGAAINGSRNIAIIRAIVSLAKSLGMETTAEGAETAEELELTRELGCSHVQGYIYGRPMSSEDIVKAQRESSDNVVVATRRGFRMPGSANRKPVNFHHDGHNYVGWVRNVSANGALVEGLWNVPEGTNFLIEVDPDKFVAATARWSRNDRMGVEFSPDGALDSLRAEMMV